MRLDSSAIVPLEPSPGGPPVLINFTLSYVAFVVVSLRNRHSQKWS